jgi:hypothetical protein
VKRIYILLIILLSLVSGALVYKNIQLNKLLYSDMKSVERFDSIYTDKLFSFNYPDNLFPLVDIYADKTEISFYLDEDMVRKAEKCIKLNADTMEDPCGYGSLIFIMDVYLNTRAKNSDVNWLFDSQNLKEASSITDEKGRIWKIVKGLPWTGSKMNISNDYFVNSKDGKDIVVGVARPDYSKYRVSLEFNKKLLSTFDF